MKTKINNEKFKKWDWLLYIPIVGLIYHSFTASGKRALWGEEMNKLLKVSDCEYGKFNDINDAWFAYLTKSNNTWFYISASSIVIAWAILVFFVMT